MLIGTTKNRGGVRVSLKIELEAEYARKYDAYLRNDQKQFTEMPDNIESPTWYMLTDLGRMESIARSFGWGSMIDKIEAEIEGIYDEQ